MANVSDLRKMFSKLTGDKTPAILGSLEKLFADFCAVTLYNNALYINNCLLVI